MTNSMTADEFNRRGSKAHKYGVSAAPERTYRGRVFSSKAEAVYARDLDTIQRGGHVRLWVSQPIVLLGEDTAFRPDFLVIGRIGAMDFVDVKGAETREFIAIKKLWRKYGPADLRVVKYANGGFETVEIVSKQM